MLERAHLVSVSNRQEWADTSLMVTEATQAGATNIRYPGSSSLCLSRNIAISQEVARCGPDQVIVFHDDDVACDVEGLTALVTQAVTSERPVSGVGVKHTGAWLHSHYAPGLYLASFSLLAVRAAVLQAKSARVRPFQLGERTFYEWCRACVCDGSWYDDDYSFCLLLGGAELCPEAVIAHRSEVGFKPDEKSLDLLRRELLTHGI